MFDIDNFFRLYLVCKANITVAWFFLKTKKLIFTVLHWKCIVCMWCVFIKSFERRFCKRIKWHKIWVSLLCISILSLLSLPQSKSALLAKYVGKKCSEYLCCPHCLVYWCIAKCLVLLPPTAFVQHEANSKKWNAWQTFRSTSSFQKLHRLLLIPLCECHLWRFSKWILSLTSSNDYLYLCKLFFVCSNVVM